LKAGRFFNSSNDAAKPTRLPRAPAALVGVKAVVLSITTPPLLQFNWSRIVRSY